MKTNTTTALVAVGALLFGGVATAALMNNRTGSDGRITGDAPVASFSDSPLGDVIGGSGLDYAQVIKVDPVTQPSTLYATVLDTEPVRETTTTSTPHEVCNDVVVQERLPERDGNVGGTVAGAVIGGLLGNQLGGGDGRKVAAAAGAVAGGAVGNRMDRNHLGGRTVARTERQCHTETASSESTRVTGYNVTYRNPDGTTGTMRMASKPDGRIAIGETQEVLGYDVTYRYEGRDQTLRMQDKPESDRLPVIDGKVVTQTAAVDAPSTQG